MNDNLGVMEYYKNKINASKADKTTEQLAALALVFIMFNVTDSDLGLDKQEDFRSLSHELAMWGGEVEFAEAIKNTQWKDLGTQLNTMSFSLFRAGAMAFKHALGEEIVNKVIDYLLVNMDIVYYKTRKTFEDVKSQHPAMHLDGLENYTIN